MKKLFLLAVLLIVIMGFRGFLFSAEENGDKRLEAIFSSVARPRLGFPADKTIQIKPKGSVRFQWALSTGTAVKLDYIELSIYKIEPVKEQAILIFKERLGPKVYSLQVDSQVFDTEGKYLWGITQFFLRGERSSERFAVFEVRKIPSGVK